MEKYLIVVTGISGSGKTTLAQKLEAVSGFHYLALDDFKVKVYERYGFLTEEERILLRKMAVCEFSAEILQSARSNESLIIDYPFSQEWQSLFDYVRQQYDYRIVVVNCNTRNFEDIWADRIARDSDFSVREKSLTAAKYVRDELYVPDGHNTNSYKKIKQEQYENNKYCRIVGDVAFTDEKFYEFLKDC